ncbi:MAPEG family protein [Cochlodiniinecator piscidefendens]|uniref:MAPEG family protein n=1 Tax=Cochlodiniinecator piscidefendens TaxID=2715756 RepID=UPI00140B47F9|nr:MAPEG family protein [Cochlodiniinecator piscidefendens]
MPFVTPLYAGIIGLFYVFLSFRVIFRRKNARVSIGDGEDKELQKRIRVQANCGEYAPITLLLILMAELQGAPIWVIHLLGIAFISGRILHARGFGARPQIMALRQAGMILTFIVIVVASLANIGHAFY